MNDSQSLSPATISALSLRPYSQLSTKHCHLDIPKASHRPYAHKETHLFCSDTILSSVFPISPLVGNGSSFQTQTSYSPYLSTPSKLPTGHSHAWPSISFSPAPFSRLSVPHMGAWPPAS